MSNGESECKMVHIAATDTNGDHALRIRLAGGSEAVSSPYRRPIIPDASEYHAVFWVLSAEKLASKIYQREEKKIFDRLAEVRREFLAEDETEAGIRAAAAELRRVRAELATATRDAGAARKKATRLLEEGDTKGSDEATRQAMILDERVVNWTKIVEKAEGMASADGHRSWAQARLASALEKEVEAIRAETRQRREQALAALAAAVEDLLGEAWAAGELVEMLRESSNVEKVYGRRRHSPLAGKLAELAKIEGYTHRGLSPLGPKVAPVPSFIQ